MDKYVNTDIGIYHITEVCDERTSDGHKLYHVKCKYCDYENDMTLSHIKCPKICRHKAKTGRIIDFQPLWSNKKLERVYKGMINRCYNNKDKSYRWYGGKGVQVCLEWRNNPKSFELWAINNGYADGLTIDRINSDKDYCPENCQWIPFVDNARKAGKVNWLTIDGITLTGKQWAQKLNIGINTINIAIRSYGEDKTKELICAMLKEPPSTKHRKPQQTWFAVYDIQLEK